VSAGLKSIKGKECDYYRQVFSSATGRIVLAHMLDELCFFLDKVETQDQRILSNYAKRLLGHCGIWRPPNEISIVEKFFEIPLERERK
jgi:hypothetical protein